MPKWFVAASALVLVAGCVGPQAQPPGQGPQDLVAEPSGPVEDGQPSTLVPAIRNVFSLDDCTGLATSAILPSDLIGANPPSSWGPSPTPLTEVRLEIYECGRVAFGQLERPATIIVQVHDNRDAPAGCEQGLGTAYSSSEVIHRILVTDHELVTALASLGLPVVHANFSKIESELADQKSRIRWTIVVDDSESWLERHLVQEPNLRTSVTYRRYWTNQEGGISYFDWAGRFFFNGQEVEPFVGQLQQPFLRLGDAGAFTALGSIDHESGVAATLSQFGDEQCEKPLSFS